MKARTDGGVGARPIRVGLIGHGQAGRFLHGPLIEAAGGFRIVAVATSRTASLAMRRDAPRQEREPERVIEAADIDLVVIAVPNDRHHALAAAALAAGKHVVVDKPFTLDAGQADQLIALAKANRRVLTVFHNRRWDGDFMGVREVLSGGELGELRLFEARWDRFRPCAPVGWRNSADPGAGVLWDLGAHLLDQALQLFGPPEALRADIAAQRQDALADDYFELTLSYGRMRCILSASSVVAAERPRFSAHGTRGSFTTHGVDPIEAALKAAHHPQDPAFRANLPAVPGRLVTEAGDEPRDLPAGDWVQFYVQLEAAIREGAPPPVSPAEARDVVALMERALLAARR